MEHIRYKKETEVVTFQGKEITLENLSLHEDQAPSGELSRLCVRKDMQGQGIAKQMMNYAGDVLKNRGMKGIHILVREGHVVALSTYAKIGFRTVGECDLFDKHFICMEKKF